MSEGCHLRVVDVRQDRPSILPKSSPGLRDPSDIDSLMLHQTAVSYGNASDEALIERFEKVPYHAILFRRGLLVLSRNFRVFSHHGNDANPFSIGFAIEGLYPGIKGGKVWGSKPETPWSTNLGVLLRESIQVIFDVAASEQIHLKKQISHRQVSVKRRSDPGEEIWRDSIPRTRLLGLSIDKEWTLDKGRPIPYQWGGTAKY